MPKQTTERVIDTAYSKRTGSGGVVGSGSATSIPVHGLESIYHTGTLDSRYYTETELDAGQLNSLYYTETESDAIYTPLTRTLTAGAGLTGGGTLAADRTFAVGAGTLITVNADDVALSNGSAQYQIPITGSTPFTPAYTSISTLKGNGLTYASGVLTLGTPTLLSSTSTDAVTTSSHSHSIDSTIARSAITVTGTGSLGGGGDLTANRTISLNTPGTLTVASSNSSATNHTHTVTSSSAPGAAASILASNSSGQLTLPLMVATTSITTPLVTAAVPMAINSADGSDTSQIDLKINGTTITKVTNNGISSSSYASQTTGWQITPSGGADFRYLFVDEMHAKSFIADLEQALAGGQIISKSVAVLYANFTAPAAAAATTLTVRDLPSATGMAAFVNGDMIRIRNFSRSAGSLSISDCWGTVVLDTSYGTSGFDSSTKTQRYTFTRSSGTIGAGNAPGAMTAGTIVAADAIILDYGTTGNGFYEVNAIDGAYGTNSPYAQIVSWTTHPANGQTVRARLGNLKGLFAAGDEYGLYAGTGVSTNDSYLRMSNIGVTQNNITSEWRNSGTVVTKIDASSGMSLETYDTSGGVIGWGDQRMISWEETIGAAVPDGAIWTERESVLNRFYIQSNVVGSRNGEIAMTAKGAGYTEFYLTGGSGSGSSASLYTKNFLIDLGSGTSGTGKITAYASQFLLADLTPSAAGGTAAAPLISRPGDTDTGIYWSAANQLNFAAGGSSMMQISTSFVSASIPILVSGVAGGDAISIRGTNTGIASVGFMTFYDSGGSTRFGYLGDASASNDNITLHAEQGDLVLKSSTGDVTLDATTTTITGEIVFSGASASWTAVSFGTGWGNFGSGLADAKYCKIGDVVYLAGLPTRISGTGLTLFTLPSGYRPTNQLLFSSIYTGNLSARIDISTAGVVTWNGGTTTVGHWVTLSGICFRTTT